jgi:hypothetical protein
MELILHLFRNLLCAGEPTFKDAEKVQASAALHQELIALFEREMVLDFITVIGQEMENRENKQYNLLLMEILHHMFKNQVCHFEWLRDFTSISTIYSYIFAAIEGPDTCCKECNEQI